jgi:GntR family transcriptional regulator
VEWKYTQVLAVLQERIEHGQLPVGTLLPSEAQLTAEFGTSRATVVRALRQLRNQGWVRGMQGRGRMVLGRPEPALATLPRRIQFLLQADRHAECLGVFDRPASPRIAAALSVKAGAEVFVARYRLTTTGRIPLALTTAFTPFHLPNERDLLSQLDTMSGHRPHQVTERLGARLSTEAETTALALTRRRSVAITLLTVHDTRGTPFLAVDAILSREAPELTERYEL